VSIGQVKVNEKSVSEFRVEQGRELSIARQFSSVMKRHGSNRSEVECDSDNSLNTAEEHSVSCSVVSVDQGGALCCTMILEYRRGRVLGCSTNPK